jgi:hypothetical protein
MTTNEMIIEVLKLLGQIGIFGIAAYWIQKQIDKAANKRLEEYKSTLSLLKLKGISLHSKRFEVIENLYGKLVELEFSLHTLTNPVKFAPNFEKHESELVENSNQAFQSYHIFFEKNKIYFSDETCKMIHEIRNAFYNAIWNYNQPRILKAQEIDDKEMLKEARQNMMKSYKSVKDDIPKLRAELESEFRKILLVE